MVILIRRVAITRSAVVVCLLVVYVMAPSCPVTSYRAVSDLRRGFFPSPDKVISISGLGGDEYMIRDGVLWLRIDSLTHFGFAALVFNDDPWTAERIRAFRAVHKELEGHWPEPLSVDGGVAWVVVE